jgi:hypothetical protein
MKPYYLKNAGEYHSRLTTKLAVLLLALPVCGAFAAEPDYHAYVASATVPGVATLETTPTITTSTLSGAVVTAAGTAANLNTNVIGWGTATITGKANLYLVGTALTGTSGSVADMTIGGNAVASATANSSYNTLTIQDYVTVNAGALTIGQGALGTGDNAKVVDATKAANSNALAITGAAYSANNAALVSSTLSITGGITLGGYGNSNTISIASGAQVSATGALLVGVSDADNLTAGSNNAITVSGKVDVSVLGFTGSSASTLTAAGAIVGVFGSSNTVTVSDSGKLILGDAAALVIGGVGSTNKVTVTSGSVSVGTGVKVGDMPSAKSNEISLTSSTLANSASATAGNLQVGVYGQSNKATLASSTAVVTDVTVGLGDNDLVAATGYDNTKGAVATEGSSNTLTATSSTIKASGILTVGQYGSSNTVTLSGTNLYSAWTDLVHGSVAKDDKVQLDEITGISSIVIGEGKETTSTDNFTAFGSNNTLAISGASVFGATGDLELGHYGSSNTLSIQGASTGKVGGNASVGEGSSTIAAQGSNNTLSLAGASNLAVTGGFTFGQYGSSNSVILAGASTVTVGGNLSLSETGSSNSIVINGGSSLKVTGNFSTLGVGLASTSSVNNSTLGSSNSISVSGTGSALAVGAGDAMIGDYGSNNSISLSNKATASFGGDIFLGNEGQELGTVLKPNRVYSHGNSISVTSGATLTGGADITIGVSGTSNSLTVSGTGSVADFSNGTVTVGEGNDSGTVFGSGNTITVADNAVLIAEGVSIGSSTTNYGSNNTVTVSSGAIVVVEKGVAVNTTTGDENYLRLNNGMVAFLGKTQTTNVTWGQYLVTGTSTVTSLVSKGVIQIWSAAAKKYVAATASDLSVAYYSSEAEAKAATGYEGLAGYTVLSVSGPRTFSWAGTVYDAGNNQFCSSWYGWFYSDAAYGDWIMSYNDYSWQYVAPDSTPDSTYIYDSNLAAWLYTNQTYYQHQWVYNYATSAWQQLGK